MKKFFPIVGLLLLVVLMGAGCTPAKPKEGDPSINRPDVSIINFPFEKIEPLAKALTAAGVKVYGSQFCSACKTQKDMFGDAWQFVTYIECATSDTNPAQNAACRADKIKLYPTWELPDGTRLEGVQRLEELAQRIGFQF